MTPLPRSRGTSRHPTASPHGEDTEVEDYRAPNLMMPSGLKVRQILNSKIPLTSNHDRRQSHFAGRGAKPHFD
jgi:hypothetical protein